MSVKSGGVGGGRVRIGVGARWRWCGRPTRMVEIKETLLVEAVEVIKAAEDSDARDITHYLKCKPFLFFEATEAVEVIEVSDVITSGEIIEPTEVFRATYTLEIDNLIARITSF